jgi:lipopolysaccharide/colanic/teichoic acid biosynthesis glycosyltransferase
MEMQAFIKPKPERRKLKYYSVPSKAKKRGNKSHEFFFIGNDKRVISLLLSNFDAGFCSENLLMGSQIINMLITRKISLPDVMIIQDGFQKEELDKFFQDVQNQIHSIPVIIEGSNTPEASLNQYKNNQYVDDVFVLNHGTVNQFIKKIGFLKRIKETAETPVQVSADSNEKPLKVFWKQFFDIVFALIALAVLSPLFMIIAAVIRLESKGPVIYCSPRVGRGYKIFKFYKFRTMEVGADLKVPDLVHLNQYPSKSDKKSPMFFKVVNDPRVTRFGNFLRNTSLDELPQLFNVLKGDMSIVGNRPLPLYEAETLTTDEWAERFLAPAGITGLWQIRKKDNHNMSIEERIHLDIDYAKKHNFIYDLWILANTPTALIQKEETV